MAIAIDAMGGDVFPRNPVLGAVKAVREKGLDVLLVGDESAIKKELDRCDYEAARIEIVPTTQVVSMEESVAAALRTKKDSSLRVCFELHRQGLAEGLVSAGNSGAMLALGRYVMKMVPGIDRPCISAILPSLQGKVLLVDAGANTDCSAQQLFQFAVLGHLYLSEFYEISSPRIGLLNVGTEEGKGDERRRKAYELLKASPLNFVGNIEGENLFQGRIDVVVTDGFAGNILLKSVQAAAQYMVTIFEREVRNSLVSQLGALWLRSSLLKLRKQTHYAEFGGAPLLGLKGNAIVCHGKSNPDAIAFGIGLAHWAAQAKLAERMNRMIDPYVKLLI